jgi:CDGSH-type Zn-finger protein
MPENDRWSLWIIIKDNGPYLVLGGVPLVRRYAAKTIYGEPMEWDAVGVDGYDIPVEGSYELCRCGQSKNMPFCDKTHQQITFDGELKADHRLSVERRRSFQGSNFVMTDDGILCSSAGFCGTRLIKVWKMIQFSDDPEVRARILRMVENCPSGRLVAWTEDGQALEPRFQPSIAAVTDGPLWVRGGISIEAPDGFVYEVRNRVTLCRCGSSRIKPFCDGSHEQTKFTAP